MKTVNKINTILASLILLLFCSNSIAKEVRGKSILSYEGSYKKSKVIDLINIGRDKACRDALKNWSREISDESKRMIFEGIKDQVFSNAYDYMNCEVEVSVPDLSNKEDVKKIKQTKTIKIVMRADIDVTKIDIEINKSSKVFDSSTSEKSTLAMIFFSRTVAAQRQFDERVTNVEKTTKGVDINEEESETGISSMTTETNVSETGGSTLKKADISEYIVDDNDTVKLEAGMKEIFTKARFEPISGPRKVRRNWRKLKSEILDSLESGGGIPEEVRWEIEDILAEKSVNYVVFAYFDVGVPDVDAATGNQIVNVALTIAEITRLGNGDPVSLGTISGVQGRGQGSDNSIAKNNAINAVAKNTAKKLVALINSKGIN